MSEFLEKTWSNDPNAPKLPPSFYLGEKANFAGSIIGAILYGTSDYSWVYLVLTPSARSIFPGIVIILFSQCMGVLLNPINRTRGGTKLGLMTYIVIMFSLATINIAINLYIPSVAYVDSPNELGPYLQTKAIQVVPTVTLFLNFWLADGLLVSSVPSAAAHVFIADCSSSSIVALSSMP